MKKNRPNVQVNKEKNVEERIPPILKNLLDKKTPIIILHNEKRFDADILKYLEKNQYKEMDYKHLYPRITLQEYESLRTN